MVDSPPGLAIPRHLVGRNSMAICRACFGILWSVASPPVVRARKFVLQFEGGGRRCLAIDDPGVFRHPLSTPLESQQLVSIWTVISSAYSITDFRSITFQPGGGHDDNPAEPVPASGEQPCASMGNRPRASVFHDNALSQLYNVTCTALSVRFLGVHFA